MSLNLCLGYPTREKKIACNGPVTILVYLFSSLLSSPVVLRAPEALTPFLLLTGLRPFSQSVLEISNSFWVLAKPEILETRS